MYSYRLLVCLLFLIALVSSACETEEPVVMNDWKQFSVKGKVKEIQTDYYASYPDLLKKKKAYRTISRFSKTGYLHDYANYEPNGLVYWTKYTYVNDSIIAKKYLESNNGREVWQGTWIYLLDERKAQVQIDEILVNKELNFSIKTQTNAAGFNTQLTYTDKLFPDRVPCKVTRQYDDQNQLIEEHIWNYDVAKGECYENPIKIHRKNNEWGDAAIEKIFNLENVLVRDKTYVYKYDSLHNWTDKRAYEHDNITAIELRKIIYY